MRTIVLDIETLKQDPESFMLATSADDLKPPANYKDPAKIAEWKAEKLATQASELRDRTSLEALFGGAVLAVGVARDDQSPVALVSKSGDEEGELAILTQLQSALSKYPDHTLVTWNGSGFDLRFLRLRALRHGLYSLAARCWQDKPWSTKHIDLRLAWGGSDRNPVGKLHQVAAFLGVSSDDQVKGSQVSDLFAAGDIESVRRHVLEDVRLTRELLWRFASAGWVSADVPESVELYTREPRRTEAQELLVEARSIVVDAAAQDIRRIAESAGIPWREGKEDGESGPYLTRDTTAAQLRAYLDGLRALKASSQAA